MKQKPAALAPRFDSMPAALKAIPRWVLWRYVWKADVKLPNGGKWDKPPLTVKGMAASSTDPTKWATFAEARAAYGRGGFDGVGFVFSDADRIFGLDLDDKAGAGKYLDATGEPTQAARELLDPLATFTEKSPSGFGVHAYGFGELPGKSCRVDDVEMYQAGRYFTLTGHVLGEYPDDLMERQGEVEGVYERLFPAPPKRTAPRAASAPLPDDAELLQKAFGSKNGAAIQALYNGDMSAYQSDHSRADAALCGFLAFWSGGDPARLDGWFRRSALMREKWDTLHGAQTYGEMTVHKAIEKCSEFFTPTTRMAAGAKTTPGTPKAKAEPQNPPKFRLDGTGNAERFIHRHGDNLRFDHLRKVWYCWNGKRWQEDKRGQAQEWAKETAVSLYAEANAAAKEGDDAGAAALSVWAKATNKARAVADMLQLATTAPIVATLPEDFDPDPWRFNCQNGTLDLRTGELRPHDRADLITRISPAKYAPDAPAPLWAACLERWQPDSDVRAFLQRFAGYTLTGEAGEETALFLYGLGRNGKSKFVAGLKHVMGDYAADLRIEILMESKRENTGTTPDLDPLPGCRMLVVGEIKNAGRLNESFLKLVTGGERVPVNPKYGKVFTFKPQFKPYLFGNHKPQVNADEGIRSRFPLVPFTQTIPVAERDAQLEKKLQAEADGILAWAVAGCLEYQKQRLTPPEAILAATKAYHEEMDTFGQFVADACILGSKLWTPVAHLRDAYEKYMEDRGDRVLTGNQFAERLRQAGCEFRSARFAGKQARGWDGIALKSDRENEANNEANTGSNPPSSKQNVYGVYADNGEKVKVPHEKLQGDFIGNDVNGVNAVNILKKTLAALQAAYEGRLEPGEQICLSRVRGSAPRVVMANSLGVATHYWGGPTSGQPVRKDGMDVWPWEHFDYPFYLRDFPPVEVSDDAPAEDDGPSLYDEYDTDPFADGEEL